MSQNDVSTPPVPELQKKIFFQGQVQGIRRCGPFYVDREILNILENSTFCKRKPKAQKSMGWDSLGNVEKMKRFQEIAKNSGCFTN